MENTERRHREHTAAIVVARNICATVVHVPQTDYRY